MTSYTRRPYQRLELVLDAAHLNWRMLPEAVRISDHASFRAAEPLIRSVIHDRDLVYGKEFGAQAAKLGIVRTPPRSPKAIAERRAWTLRSEVLDHIIVINERHLLSVLTEFAD